MRNYRVLRVFLMAGLAPVAGLGVARAQPVTPVITVTATRVPTPVKDVPAGVTVITRAEMQARGETTLVQALAAVPGVGVVQSGGPGNVASVFVRGTNSEDVLVLLDGVPVNDPSEANGAFNFGDFTLDDVERIEVVRGPMSGLYGANAIGGVINIITRRGAGRPKAQITLAGGFPSQGRANAEISGASGRFDYALSGALDEESGFDATAKRLSVYAGVRDPYRAALGAVNMGYTPVAGVRVYVVLRAQQTDASSPDLGYPIYDDANQFEKNTDLFGKIGVTAHLFQGALTTDLFVARLANELHFTNLLDAADPNQVQANDVYRGGRTDIQWNNELRLPDAGVSTASYVSFGAEYSDDTSREAVNEAYFGSPFVETVRASQNSLAGHVGAQTILGGLLTLDGALRDDKVSSFGNALTARAGGVLKIPGTVLGISASYGTGFLAPSLFDLYGVDNFGYVGNPHLRAEYSSGFDAGPEATIPGFGRADLVQASVRYFNTDIRDLITSTPDFLSEENIGRVKIDGVESEVNITPASWMSLDVNYTYTKARDAQTGAALLRRPQSAGSATMTLTPWQGLSVTPQVQYVGRFVDFLYDNNGYPAGTGYARPGTIVNLNVTYELSDKFTMFATGRNILNSAFEPVNGLQIPGASLLLGVRTTID
ncbi:MAG: TonB-dependent receptor [Acidocella sp.]|nr:TonB-dependent receptor [Acidocella sp.]